MIWQSQLLRSSCAALLVSFRILESTIDAFADKARLLTDLTAKRVPQNITSLWTERHSEALKTLKSDLALACETSLHTVQLDRPYDVYVRRYKRVCRRWDINPEERIWY